MRKSCSRSNREQSLASVIREKSAAILAKNKGMLGVLELTKELRGIIREYKLRGDYVLSSLYHSNSIEIQGKDAILIGRCVRRIAPSMAARKKVKQQPTPKIPAEVVNFFKAGKFRK